MTYKEYFKKASAQVSYWDLGRDDFPDFDDVFEEIGSDAVKIKECGCLHWCPDTNDPFPCGLQFRQQAYQSCLVG